MNSTLSSLIRVNTTWLEQALALVSLVDDHRYSSQPPGFGPHTAGRHLRHILEFYECFLDGVEHGRVVDYDSRKRDPTIETDRGAATSRIRRIIDRLFHLRASDEPILVQVDDCDARSTIARELQVLSSHTIHHFALIAMTLHAYGLRVDPRFGVAPSTLRYQEQRQSQGNAEAA
jgi:uncharacterized damage-inducible protein DinB